MVRINYKVLVRCYPVEILFPIVGITIGLVLLPTYLMGGGVVIAITLATWISGYVSWKNHLASGVILPAIVVNPKKDLIAILANMDSQGGRPYLVVRVIKKPISRGTGAPFKKASRLAAITNFKNSNILSNKRWTDIDPIVVNCVTAKKKTIRRVLDTIEDEEWELLISALKQMKQPFKAGIYPLNSD